MQEKVQVHEERFPGMHILGYGVFAILLSKAAGNNAFFNGLSTAWISIGDIWMTGGLLLTMKKAKRMENKR